MGDYYRCRRPRLGAGEASGGVALAAPQRVHSVDRQTREGEGRFSTGVARAAACLWTFAALMCGCCGGFHREPRSWRVL